MNYFSCVHLYTTVQASVLFVISEMKALWSQSVTGSPVLPPEDEFILMFLVTVMLPRDFGMDHTPP